MCGIAGFVDKKNTLSVEDRAVVLGNMLKEIQYRGYDSSGTFINNFVSVGHNRLAILDTSKKAEQPFVSKDKSLVISYNGEIFNHFDLRNLVEDYEYKTRSDTETFLVVYEKIRQQIFTLIRGMFAVCLYDAHEQTITLSVDGFGIKPLYYINTPDWFAWSSEIKAFKCLPGFSFSLNENKLFEHAIFRTSICSETLFNNVPRLNPSEILKYDIKRDKLERSTYVYKSEISQQSIENLLEASVSEHTLADVPIGLQLSGGVDSSLIGALAKGKINQEEVHSFSIGLNDPDWNEFKYSREVARQIGTQHHEIEFDQIDFCENLPKATFHMDEPIGPPNTVPIMILSREARKYVKVLLSGEGADEIFGGYLRYLRLTEKEIDEETLIFSNSLCTKEDVLKLFITENEDIGERGKIAGEIRDESPIRKLGIYDVKTFLPHLLLRQDKMGMASNLENRFPFLDPRLVISAMNLPDSEKCVGDKGKIYLKSIARKHLPNSIVDRKKCGFGLPIKDWLKDENGLGRYLNLFKKPEIKRNYLNYENILKSIDEHIGGTKDNSEILWVLISLEVWAKIFIDGENYKEIWATLKNV